MRAMIATFHVHSEQATVFERLFAALSLEVREKEQDTRLYQLTRSRSEPSTLKLMELYTDDAAFEFHMATPWLKAAGPSIRPLLSGPPILEVLDTVE